MTRDIEPTLALVELRAALRQRGIEISDSQLKRRRREGLLLVLEQRAAPGLRGSQSRYPAWSVAQLELVDRLSQRERRFAQLAVLVRWNGGWVRPDKLRAALCDLLEPLSAQARQLTGSALDIDEQTDRLAEALTAAQGQAPMSKLMRRRLDHARDDIQRTMFAFAALATHGELEWQNHDPDNPNEPLLAVVERALGLDRARKDDVGGNGPMLDADESSQQILARLQSAGAFDLLDLTAIFVAASDEMIDRAFQDAIACAGLGSTFDAIQVIAGADVSGLASFTEFAAAHEAVDLAIVVRGLLLLQPLMADGAVENLVEAARRAEPQLQAASELCRALPQYAVFLGPRGPDELARLPASEREQVVREISAYLEAHPELVVLDSS